MPNVFAKLELTNHWHGSAKQQVYPRLGGHQHYCPQKVLILVADIRTREGQLSFPVALLENPRNCAESQLRLHKFDLLPHHHGDYS